MWFDAEKDVLFLLGDRLPGNGGLTTFNLGLEFEQKMEVENVAFNAQELKDDGDGPHDFLDDEYQCTGTKVQEAFPGLKRSLFIVDGYDYSAWRQSGQAVLLETEQTLSIWERQRLYNFSHDYMMKGRPPLEVELVEMKQLG